MEQQYPPPPAYGNPYNGGQPMYPPFPQNSFQQGQYGPLPIHQTNVPYNPGYQNQASTNAQNFAMNGQLLPQTSPFPFPPPPPPLPRDVMKSFSHANPNTTFPLSLTSLSPQNYEFSQYQNVAHSTPQSNHSFPQNMSFVSPAGPYHDTNRSNNTSHPSLQAGNQATPNLSLKLDGSAASVNTNEWSSRQGYGANFNTLPSQTPVLLTDQTPFTNSDNPSNKSIAADQQSYQQPSTSAMPASGPENHVLPAQKAHTPHIQRGDSTASYKPPSPPSPNVNPAAVDVVQDGRYTNKSPLELKSLAKSALLSLLPHDINYQALIKEGIDSGVLQTLYDELGVKTFSSHDDIRREQQLQSETTGLSTDQILNTHIDSLETTSKTQADLATDTNQSGTSTAVSTAGLERKDRIALLLAAKKGRQASTPPLPAASAQDSLSAGIVVDPAQDTVAPELITRDAPSVAKTSQQDQAASNVLSLDGSVMRVPSTAMSSGSLHASLHGSNDRLDLPGLDIRTRSIPLSALTTPVREELVRTGFSSSIPGLFMTSADSPGQTDAGLRDTATLVEHLSTNLKSDLVVQKADPPAVRHSPQVPAPINAELKLSSSPFRPPTKRPIASDAFDAATEPSNKRFRSLSLVEDMGKINSDMASNDYTSEGEILEDSHASLSGSEHLSGVKRSSAVATGSDQAPKTLQTAPPTTTSGIQENEIKTGQRPISISNIPAPVQFSRFTSNNNITSSTSLGAKTDSGGVEARAAGVVSPFGRPGPVRGFAKMTPAQLAERAAALKADLVRRNRVKALQSGIPELDVEIAKTQAKGSDLTKRLRDLQAEASRLETEAQTARQLEQEAQRDADTLEQLLQKSIADQAKFKEELQQLLMAGNTIASQTERQLNNRTVEENTTSVLIPTQAAEPGKLDTSNPERADVPQPSSVPASIEVSIRSRSATGSFSQAPSLANDISSSHEHNATGDIHLTYSNESASIDLGSEMSGQDPADEGDDDATADVVAGDNNEDETDVEDASPRSEPVGDTVINAASVNDALSGNDVESIRDSAVDFREENEGSISMSDSASEQDFEETQDDDDADYEPEEDVTPVVLEDDQDVSDDGEYEPKGPDEYDPQDSTVPYDYYARTSNKTGFPISRQNSLGSDPIMQQLDSASAAGQQQDFQPAIQGESYSESMESDHSKASFSSIATSPEEASTRSVSMSNVPGDDGETGLELTEAQTLTKSQQAVDPVEDTTQDEGDGPSLVLGHFVPYKTPLSGLKSFRYHPRYSETVKNGYRSLTYSNDIKSNQPLCPTELAGETCKDPTCEEQHFAKMGLPDDKILVQMSSANDIKDKTERDRYLVGLKQVIADLRVKEVKDFESVAEALAAHRRQFMASPATL